MGFPLVSKTVGNQKNEMVNGESTMGEKFYFIKVYGNYRGRNDLYKPPNSESLFPSTVQYTNEFPTMER